MIGKTLAHYRITEKLGAGGMGEVWRASDSKLGRDVALKMLPESFAQDAERLARFQREAQVLASLNHPNIAAIYGLEEVEGQRFLVLELVEGPTLADRQASGPVPLSEALPIACQIAEAVECAHESGTVHRDLKPANVKLTEEGRVKVLDFGLAKALADPAASGSNVSADSPTLSPTLSSPITGALTGANVILGTAAYMSPEQARGHTVDKRSDIWSFGVILFEMLTGKRLFDGETVSDTLAAVLRKAPDWDTLPPETPPRIHRLLRRCLERDRSKRLRDIGDARIVLSETIEGSDEETFLTEAPPSSPRWPIPAIGIAAVVAGLVGWLLPRDGVPPPQVSLFEVRVPDMVRDRSNWAVSPDGRRLVYYTNGMLHVREMDRLEARPLSGTQGAKCPFWSPDAKWIGFGVGNRLMKVPTAGGEPSLVTRLPTDDEFWRVGSGVWHEDGRIVFCSGDQDIYEVSSQGGEARVLLATGEGERDFHDVSALPDDRGYLYVVHHAAGHGRIVLLANGERKVLLDHEADVSKPVYSRGYILYELGGSAPGVWALPFSVDDLEVTGPPTIVTGDGTFPQVAKDGTLIYGRGGTRVLTRIAVSDRRGDVLETIGEPVDQRPFVAISPDGRLLATTIRNADARDLWVIDRERGTRSRLTSSGDASHPVWSADGRLLYFHMGDEPANLIIRALSLDGAVDDSLAFGIEPSLSPDGRKLFFEAWDSRKDASEDTYPHLLELQENGLPADGAEPVKVQDDGWSLRLSPDGRYLAYTGDATGRQEIYLRPYPTGSGLWQVSSQGGQWAEWSPDGKLLYWTQRDSVLAAEVETSPRFRLGRAEFLFERDPLNMALPFGWFAAIDVLPDDSGFVFLVPERDGTEITGSVVIMQNWDSALR